MLLVALAVTVAVPDTVAPLAGAVIDTTGGAVLELFTTNGTPALDAVLPARVGCCSREGVIPVRQRSSIQRIRVRRSSKTGTAVCAVDLKLHTRNRDIVLRARDDIYRAGESRSGSGRCDRYSGRSGIAGSGKSKIIAQSLIIFRVS